MQNVIIETRHIYHYFYFIFPQDICMQRLFSIIPPFLVQFIIKYPTQMKPYLSLFIIVLAIGQNIGTLTPENHINLPYFDCTESGCSKKQGGAVLESSWRWIHSILSSDGCRMSSATGWNPKYCQNGTECAKNCGYEGVNGAYEYKSIYGVLEVANGIRLNYKTGNNVGSRVYVTESDDKYKMFQLGNRQLSFDVDVSTLQCGMNGAIYLVQMESDGGKAKYPNNKAGAKYGTGYCDAQCPKESFIYGEATSSAWGNYGACCAQFDLWQANKQATAYTAHPCKKAGYYRCNGNTDCGFDNSRYSGTCDKDGCGNNAFRNGNKMFYGPGANYQVDTTRPFTVVTQFLTNDGTDYGQVSQIKRLYVQNGKKIPNPKSTFSGMNNVDSLSNENCQTQSNVLGDSKYFLSVGGMKAMGESLERGMVLVVSLWDDYSTHMKWLDGVFPPNADPTKPGNMKGPCSKESGDPTDLRQKYPNSYVQVTNIKSGPIGSTLQLSSPQDQLQAE